MLLYRPTGPEELRLVFGSGMKRWPPRLPEQPIFYPVLNERYAAQIARDWNASSPSQAGFVTRFTVSDSFAEQFARQVVGGHEHEELWVPADRLEDLNDQIEGTIEVVDAHYGPAFGATAAGDLHDLSRALEAGTESLAELVRERSVTIFLSFPYWARLQALTPVVTAIETAWHEIQPEIPLHRGRHVA